VRLNNITRGICTQFSEEQEFVLKQSWFSAKKVSVRALHACEDITRLSEKAGHPITRMQVASYVHYGGKVKLKTDIEEIWRCLDRYGPYFVVSGLLGTNEISLMMKLGGLGWEAKEEVWGEVKGCNG